MRNRVSSFRCSRLAMVLALTVRAGDAAITGQEFNCAKGCFMKLATSLFGRVLTPVAIAVLVMVSPGRTVAQSLTGGGVAGSVVDRAGGGVPNALLTFQRSGGGTRVVTATLRGRFDVAGLAPGEYTVLVEQVGYQPVRLIGVPVTAGSVMPMLVELDRRPPPIEAVEQRVWTGTTTSSQGEFRSGDDIASGSRWPDAAAAFGGMSSITAPLDRGPGTLAAASGLAPRHSRLTVDGIEESMLRHPGYPSETGTAPLFGTGGIGQAGHFAIPRDAELLSSAGSTLGMWSADGSAGTVRPFLDVGSAMGRDSSVLSLRGGATIGGSFRGDSSSWSLSADYRQLAVPGAAPFEQSLDGLLTELGDDGAAKRGLNPVVRRWTGGNAAGRLAWSFSDLTRLSIRVGLASWTEEAPTLGRSIVNGAGVELEASDLSVAAEFVTGGDDWISETRVGMRNGSRDWTGTGSPLIGLVGEGVAWGSPLASTGTFDERAMQLSQSVTVRYDAHRIKVGGSVTARTVTWDWLTHGSGEAWYGSHDGMTAGTGRWISEIATGTTRDIGTTELAAFVQDGWRLSRDVEVIGGVRYSKEKLPLDLLRPNIEWLRVSGGLSNIVPFSDAGSVAPRLELIWSPGGTGSPQLRLGGGMITGGHDIAALAEAARYDGSVAVRRIIGEFDRTDIGSGSTAAALTMFSADMRRPMTSFLAGSWSMAAGNGTTLTIGGSYRHTDYLPTRSDMNRHTTSVATMVDGRPTWGTMVNADGVLAAAVGSNRRFQEFDRALMITPNGYVDHYEGRLSLARAVGSGLRFSADYTFSRTRDNLLNQFSPDPVDRVSPFAADSAGAAWLAGTSDLDVPHRLAVAARWESERGMVMVRGRWQSGLPFTPGFHPGLDINGDGSDANDPVAVSGAAGLSQLLSDAGCSVTSGEAFAARNSCREASVRYLDLHGEYRVAGAVRVGVSLFNVGAGATGVVDRAALKIDPSGSVTTDAQGRVVMPLMINENFGRLLSRRTDPMMLRVGVRVEN